MSFYFFYKFLYKATSYLSHLPPSLTSVTVTMTRAESPNHV